MAYTLTIRGLSSKEDARKIAEDFFGVMRWKHEAGCTTCWPQRDEHPLTITDSAADGKIIADIRADLARVTAERDAGVVLARTVLHLVKPGDGDQATALRALRGWVEQQLGKGD